MMFGLHGHHIWAHTATPASPFEHLKVLIDDACFQRGRIAGRAVLISSGQTLFDIHGDVPLVPASTIKLITSAGALLRLSPHYRFRTAFLTRGEVRQGWIDGDVFLKGYGDPVLVLEEVWLMARGLRKQGIQGVRGALVGDDSFFDAEHRGQAWADADSQRAFNARISALSVNFSSTTIVVRPGMQPGDPVQVEVEPPSRYLTLRNTAKTVGHAKGNEVSITRLEGQTGDILLVEGKLGVGQPPQTFHRNISNPTLHATMVMAELLGREGIQIAGGVRVDRTPPNARELHVHYSRPLYRIIDDLNKFSNNFIAEQIVKTLGAEIHGPPGSWAKGLAVLNEVLEEFGIGRATYTLADGSGLSRLNRVSPAQLVLVLARMAEDFTVQAEYFASLRTPDGERRQSQRFHRSDFAGHARVKTGSLADVSALAGYVGRHDGELIAFALLMNGPFCSMQRAWQLQDTVVDQLRRGDR